MAAVLRAMDRSDADFECCTAAPPNWCLNARPLHRTALVGRWAREGSEAPFWRGLDSSRSVSAIG
eukprot:694040-Alexandrium_andersonii.AAC.1